jgi:hypothetical protein
VQYLVGKMEKEVETDLQPGPEEPLSDYEIDAELYLEGIPDLGAVVLFIHPDSAICLGVCPERLPPSLARSAEQRANEERERAAQGEQPRRDLQKLCAAAQGSADSCMCTWELNMGSCCSA